MSNRDVFLTAILAAIYLLLAIPAFSGLSNPDLMAPWAAAMAWTEGAGPELYAGTDAPFDTLAPPALQAAFDRLDYQDPRFGYIYPPLWLAVLGPLTEAVPYPAFLTAATWANNLMMVGMVALAWRAVRPARVPLPLFLLLGLLALALTQVGGLALYYNQVQIAVSFLVVLAAERTAARAPLAAGVALALAAALKGYPALLAVIWLGQRDWRALAAFALSGAGLAALSVGLTGWDMHLAYLDQLQQVAATAFVTPVTFSLPSLLAHLTMVETMEPVSYGAAHPSQIVVAWQPGWMRAATLAGLAGVLAGTFWAARRGDPLLWAVAAGAVSLCTAVAWSHHFLVTFAFLPALIGRLGWPLGGGLAFLGAAAVSYPAVPLWGRLLEAYAPLQIGGTVAVLAVVVALAAAMVVDHRETRRPQG